jgi:branched-chain amino acid transport system permease protein
MAFIFFGRWSHTRAEDGFALDKLPLWIDPSQNRLTFYYIALALFAFTFVFIRRLIQSPTGAVFQAIRENEDRAQAIGYDTLRYKLFSIAISAMLAGAAGLLQVMLNKKVGPELLAVSNTVDPLLMTLIGGAGTLLGPIFGAAGLHLLEVFFRDSKLMLGTIVIDIASIWGLLLGVIFIAAVIIFPYGIIGTWRRWRDQRQKDSSKL